MFSFSHVTDENDQSSSFDSTSECSLRHPAIRARSLSADSTRDPALRCDRSQVYSLTDDQLSRDVFLRKQPCRQNSYIEAVRHSSAGKLNEFNFKIIKFMSVSINSFKKLSAFGVDFAHIQNFI